MFSEFEKPNNSEEELARLRDRVDEVEDGLGKEVDPGIKEAVVMFNAVGLSTTGSCEGHPDQEHGLPFPWVDIGPEKPDEKDWKEDEGLREKVKKEKLRLKRSAVELLSEFYEDRNSPYDAMLAMKDIAYDFRIRSIGGDIMGGISDKEKQERYRAYKEEMDDFVEFLEEKYREGYRLLD